jgi:predicted CxxxxCH...CXXCH cytochrome family protein
MPRAANLKRTWWSLLATILTLLLVSFGCGGNTSDTSKTAYYGHYHAADWIITHPAAGISGINDCKTCHETTVLKQGGPAPSCMTADCHHVQVANWKDGTIHGSRAKTGLGATGGSFASCQVCHGADFKGAGTGVSCASCHLVNAPHPPRPWLSQAGFTHTTTDPSNAPACIQCHFPGSPNNPANHPEVPAAAGTAPGCFNNTMCHGGNSVGLHSSSFLLTVHPTTIQSGFSASCSTCHAASGSNPGSAAPSCSVCHTTGSPLAAGDGPGTCLSCHSPGPSGMPFGPMGSLSTFPDIKGVHDTHMGLPTTLNCSTCHTGFEVRSQGHYDTANRRASTPVSPGATGFGTTYKAKAGAITFNTSALTCSNISCHGAITTPNWQTGTLDPNVHAGCVQCHMVGNAVGTPENNSAYSGAHALHMGAAVGALCTDCHDMANGTAGTLAHFTTLNTPAMEGPASTTIDFSIGAAGAGTYNTSAQQCTLTCHGIAHTARPWTGSSGTPPHLVPFSTHMTTTAGDFSATCSGCHALTAPGPSPNASAPICTVCHTLGSPFANTNCTSCHARPPAGAAFPNVAGKHAKHNAFADQLSTTCSVCHLNLGTGTSGHYVRADARSGLGTGPGLTAFTATFNASGNTASFNSSAFTCSSVSCHGGITAPSWRTGTLNSATDCTQCHSVSTPAYNGPTSGRHRDPHSGFACTECHSMTNGSVGALNHFTTLSTTAMAAASGTITFANDVTGARTYDPATRGCTLTCHQENHTATQNRW